MREKYMYKTTDVAIHKQQLILQPTPKWSLNHLSRSKRAIWNFLKLLWTERSF